MHTLNVTNESLKHTQTFSTLSDVGSCSSRETVQVLMTTQTERENARYRKDVEKALHGSGGSTGTLGVTTYSRQK